MRTPKVIVGKKWDKGAEYIGRGSPLGNPYPMRNESEAERDRVCDEYKVYLDKQIAAGNPRIIRELERLARLSLRPDGVTIGCFCAPKRCHGDHVKVRVEEIAMKMVREAPAQELGM